MTLISQERAILFADVSGSTRLYEVLGDKPAQKAIETCLASLSEAVATFRGKVVKTIGEEIMGVFPPGQDAANAAHDLQHRVLAGHVAGCHHKVASPRASDEAAIRQGERSSRAREDCHGPR